jgi:GNAT superfamily N-acetyltransferase
MNDEWTRGEYTISTDPARLDIVVIHEFLTESYWASGVPLTVVKRSIEQSLAFGLYKDHRQIGFARVITDCATFAYLADVFVLGEFQGQGLGKWLIEVVMSHPDLAGLRRWMLATRDAHRLYRKSGFTELRQPERWMEKHAPNVCAGPDTAGE